MKQFSKSILGLFLAVAVLGGCKKSPIAETESDGSTKGGGRTSARNIYVSPTGDDNSANPHSSATPFKTLKQAHSITIPGDNVLLMEGTFNADATTGSEDINLDITRSGTQSGGYITYKPAPGATPIIRSVGRKWAAVRINASYIKVQDIEFIGENNNDPNTMLAAAKASRAHWGSTATKDWERYSQYNTNGFSIGQKNPPATHHVEIRNNVVHDFPGGGIAISGGDLLIVENNVSYNNCWFNMYGTSGISVHFSTNFSPTTPGYTKILRNTCYNNYSQVFYSNTPSTDYISDGNGIIIDTNDGTDSNGPSVPYNGRTLVENNVCYLNGAGGVHVLRANHVDVYNNTCYANEANIKWYGNIDGEKVADCNYKNNIAYARAGGIAFKILEPRGTVTVDRNVYFGGTVTAGGTNSKTTDPLFVDRFNRNFRLSTSPLSPAINAGTLTSPSGALIDRRGSGNPRLLGSRVDCGAYEMQ